jgi:hypothetical protein
MPDALFHAASLSSGSLNRATCSASCQEPITGARTVGLEQPKISDEKVAERNSRRSREQGGGKASGDFSPARFGWGGIPVTLKDKQLQDLKDTTHALLEISFDSIGSGAISTM